MDTLQTPQCLLGRMYQATQKMDTLQAAEYLGRLEDSVAEVDCAPV